MKAIPRDIKAPCFTKEQIERITEINFLPKQHIKTCDAMFVFGCPDPKIWNIIYDAYIKKLMKTIIISGGYNPNPKAPQKDWIYGEVSEARVIADRLIELGVPKDIIIVEDKARNSITYETILNGDIISRDNWMNTEKGCSFVWQGYLRNILYGMKGDIFPVDEPIEELQKYVLEYWD